MVSLSGLVTAVANKIAAVSAVTALAPTVAAYLDTAAGNNSLGAAVYSMTTGEVLVAWGGTALGDDGYQWKHNLLIYCKASESQSSLALLNAVVDGEASGDSVPWRLSEILPGVTIGDIEEINRVIDSQGVDYFEIKVSLLELGDTF